MVTPQHTLLDFATPTVADSQDSTSVEVGMKFRADVNGTVTGVRFYKSAANTGAQYRQPVERVGHASRAGDVR